jgi:intein/homing endonuclease
MADGTSKEIQYVNVGDWLLGFDLEDMPDESTKDWELYKTDNLSSGGFVPVQVIYKKEDTYREYYIINNDIKITKQHRLFIKRENYWQWIDSSEVKVGDYLLGKNKKEIEIKSVEYVKDILEVVTLDTEQTDNYFAGNRAVLVHNNELVK